jgi:hypothetical protein
VPWVDGRAPQGGPDFPLVQALNHSPLNFNSFALPRPFCGSNRLICISFGGSALRGGLAPLGDPDRCDSTVGRVYCVMVCAVSVNSPRRLEPTSPADLGARPFLPGEEAGRVQRRASGHPSGRYDRFATRSATLARGAAKRRLSYGVASQIPAMVITGTMKPGMVDSGAAMAGVCAPAKWGGSAGSGALLNRGSR